jgi:mannose-6-phosphate isomerase-like protein (cupin superfamily)
MSGINRLAPGFAPGGAAVGAAQERRYLSDLLRRGADGTGPVLADEQALRRAAAVEDPLLYVAHRDVRVRTVGAGGPDSFHWRADLVEYTSGDLAEGQPVRSVGHWNHPDQVEIFQILAGRVVMLIGDDSEGGYVSLADYRPGDLAVVPPGWFHFTCSPWQPSTVYNIYTAPAWNGTDATGKYHRRPPLPHLVRLDGESPVLVGRPATSGHRPALAPTLLVTDQLNLPRSTGPAEDLPQLMAAGSEPRLRELRDRIATARARGWPARPAGAR